jgi:PhnB protein
MSDQVASYPLMSPGLAVRDAGKAIEFYKEAFGAVERFRLIDPNTGAVGHSELTINGCLVMVAEEYPEYNTSPETLGGTPIKMSLLVDDVDAAVDQALSAGATILMPACDAFYGFRCASIRDPYGHEWMFQHEIEKLTPTEMQNRWNTM